MRIAAGGLETYRAAAGSGFLAKADIGLGNDRLDALPGVKERFGAEAAGSLATELARTLGDPSVEVEHLPGHGTFHALFRVRSAGRRLWARTSVPEVPWPALDFAVSEWLSETLPARGIPLARTLHLDLSRDRIPFDVELVEDRPGSPMPPGPGNEAAASELGACLARLHRVSCSGWGPIDPGPIVDRRSADATLVGLHTDWRDYLLLRLDQHLEICRASRALPEPMARAVGDAIERGAAAVSPDRSVLLHGDLGNRNVIFDGDRIVALLDWEDALAGDPLFDLAGWGTFIGNEPRRTALVDAYRSEAGAHGSWEDFELRYWLYYLRIVLAKTVHRHRFGYSRTDRIPAAERLMPALEALRGELATVT